MKNIKREHGFTLIEVLAVIIIIGILGAVAIPKLVASTLSARQKADVATAHQVKGALDRYQLENGTYPKGTDLAIANGTVTSTKLIPKYISKLDSTITQQAVPATGNKGFGTAALVSEDNYIIPDTATLVTNTIMIYMSSDGLA
ncbi:MAG TPA: prepilin-type N-terminal cleavage/methylation domain-containing protein, partial [Desulfosporosinus sp.]|nr:prepilin-type N-terminal cleavage/methylation domain-containing protein [Desulfosporosinus sp.]